MSLRKRTSLILLALILFSTGCDSGGMDDLSGTLESGTWGNEMATLVVSKSNAEITFACAAGTLNLPIVFDEHGEFTTTGELVSGPLAGNERPVEYLGRAKSSDIELTITFSDSTAALGTFLLRKNPSEEVFYVCRC